MIMPELVTEYIAEYGSINMSEYARLVVISEAVTSIKSTPVNKFKKALKEYKYAMYAKIEEDAAKQNVSRTSKVVDNEKSKADSKIDEAVELVDKIYSELTSNSPSLGVIYKDGDVVATQFASLIKKVSINDADVAQISKIWSTLKRNHTKDVARNTAASGIAKAGAFIGKMAERIKPRDAD